MGLTRAVSQSDPDTRFGILTSDGKISDRNFVIFIKTTINNINLLFTDHKLDLNLHILKKIATKSTIKIVATINLIREHYFL